jgi:DsbC/DsbD-like thiol-disulfide interchange protein
VAAISYDSVPILKSFADRKNIGIPLLSDSDSSFIRALGILNEQIPKNTPFYGVPNPVTLIVDPSGKVQSVHFEEDFRKRYSTGAILSDPAGGSENLAIRNSRISVTSSASDTTVRGGERIRLFLTIRLPKSMHVYAPGVEGYIPVKWEIKAGPATPLEPVFPASRMLRLEAIQETVPVYVDEFVLTRDVVLAQAADLAKALDADRKVALEGTFRYQACDDTKCYVPEQVPLRWTFACEPPDSTRAPAELQRKAPAR